LEAEECKFKASPGKNKISKQKQKKAGDKTQVVEGSASTRPWVPSPVPCKTKTK
jgi:hypothetical protein